VLLKVSTGCELWIFSGIAISMGVFIMLDTQVVNMWPNLIVFNTNVHIISLLFTALLIMMGLVSVCTEVVKRVMNIVIVAYGAIHLLVLFKVTEKELLLWDMLKYWALITSVIVLVLLAFATLSIIRKKNRKVAVYGMFSVLAIVLLIELVNGYIGIWDFGYGIKIVYCLIFAIQLVFVTGYLIKNHGVYAKSKMLERELEHSRIVLSLGQIKNHFIFNVLNAISGMCKSEPEKADETVILFSRYLRNHMSILEDSDLVAFDEVMNNLTDYVELEKIRFGEKITYKQEIDFTNFIMPQMILQPLVENSLKHGILPKAEGGTICIKTFKEKGNVVIKVIDDGIGFDDTKEYREDSLGICNVRYRLKHMVNGKLDIESEIGKGTVVKNSILFQDTFTGENVTLNCVIADKNVVIRDNKNLSGDETLPFYLAKGKMI
jgi:two-component sensor histidine kinase